MGSTSPSKLVSSIIMSSMPSFGHIDPIILQQYWCYPFRMRSYRYIFFFDLERRSLMIMHENSLFGMVSKTLNLKKFRVPIEPFLIWWRLLLLMITMMAFLGVPMGFVVTRSMVFVDRGFLS